MVKIDLITGFLGSGKTTFLKKYAKMVQHFFIVCYDKIDRVIRQKNAVSIAVMVLAFAVTFVFQVNVVLILLACAAVGVVQALVRSRRQRRNG